MEQLLPILAGTLLPAGASRREIPTGEIARCDFDDRHKSESAPPAAQAPLVLKIISRTLQPVELWLFETFRADVSGDGVFRDFLLEADQN